MKDTIYRQDAIDAIKKNTFRLTFAEEQNCEGHVAWSAEAVYSDVMEGALLELPSAQSERKTGKWITHYYKLGTERYECNVCHNRIGDTPYYCPNCGADMRGAERREE